MKKILFPTDFSNAAANAFVYALHLAKKVHAEIVTLHVYEVADAFDAYYDFVTENYYSIAEWNNFENYKDEVSKLRLVAEQHNCGNVKMRHILQRGNVVRDILSWSDTEKADYIVMGTTGATGLKEVFLGSIAEKVINQSPTIVLAVPIIATFGTISNILFLAELDKLQQSHLKKVQQFAKVFNASIDVLQVKKHHADKDLDILARWKSEFPDINIDFYILTSNDIENTVIDFMSLNKIDLAAMPVHKKHIFEKLFLYSLSRQLAFHSQVPVMSIPIL